MARIEIEEAKELIGMYNEKRMVRYSINSIDDLPSKLSYIELTSKVLSECGQNKEFGGFINLLDDFKWEIKGALAQVLGQPDDEFL